MKIEKQSKYSDSNCGVEVDRGPPATLLTSKWGGYLGDRSSAGPSKLRALTDSRKGTRESFINSWTMRPTSSSSLG